jgi:hypothetical protein
MIYTYGKGGETHNSVIPKNSRPFNNVAPVSSGKSFGKANPIQHWRKQLMPYYNTKSSQVPLYLIENPSTTITTDTTNLNLNDECNNVLFEQVLSTMPVCDGVKKNNTCSGGTNHIRRSGSTLYGEKYCSSTRQYLQRKCKSFEQNMMVGKPIDLEKFLFKTTSNSNPDTPSCVTYKQNNPSFNTIDAVVSSNYVSKKKLDAIHKNPYNPNKKLEQYCVNQTCISK